MNLTGKTVVLTGATTGIGRAAALAMADQPVRLLVHGPQTARDVSGLSDALQAAMQPWSRADLPAKRYGDVASVAQFAEELRSFTDRIDVLNKTPRGPDRPPAHSWWLSHKPPAEATLSAPTPTPEQSLDRPLVAATGTRSPGRRTTRSR